MEKEFVYDCLSAPRREQNQCYNDISALMCLTLLADPKILLGDDEENNIFRDFFDKKIGFPLKSKFSEQMQDDLITIKTKWLLIRHDGLLLELMAFIIGLIGSERKFNRFMEYYAGEENNVYLRVERLLQGLATAEGGQYGVYSVQSNGKNIGYFFNEKVAIEQFREFKKLINLERFM